MPIAIAGNGCLRKPLSTDPNTAMLEITNDYGSEDFDGDTEKNDNGTFTLTQNDGSALKNRR